MQELKSKKDEELRQTQIKKIVDEIYKEAVHLAETTTESSYNHEIPSTQMAVQPPAMRRMIKQQNLNSTLYARQGSKNQAAPDPFHIKNIKDILAGLEGLFPDCSVSHTLLCQAKDGKMYDIAHLDDAVLPFVDRALDQSYIVIDWS